MARKEDEKVPDPTAPFLQIVLGRAELRVAVDRLGADRVPEGLDPYPRGSAETDFYLNPAQLQSIKAATEPWNLGFGEIYLPPTGLVVILGGTASGKSTLAEAIWNRCDELGIAARFVRFCEPDREAILSESKLVANLANFLLGPESIAILDSFRKLAFSPRRAGGTGKGGISMGLFTELTELAVVAEKFGKLIIVVVNPLTNDEEAMTAYLDAMAGSVTGVIRCTAPGTVVYTCRHPKVSRTREGVTRRLPAAVLEWSAAFHIARGLLPPGDMLLTAGVPDSSTTVEELTKRTTISRPSLPGLDIL